MSKYTAEAERDGKFWLIRVPEIGYATQARHVREVESMARDLIETMTGERADSLELDVRVDLPASVKEHMQAAAAYRHEADEANRRAAEESRVAALELAATMPLRDAAAVLGISHQRVHQLVNH